MIGALIERMQALLEPLQAADDPRQYFHAVYLRTTIAVAEAIKGDGFTDPDWAERWDVTFAGLYLDALEAATSGGQPPRPWQIAFSARLAARVPGPTLASSTSWRSSAPPRSPR